MKKMISLMLALVLAAALAAPAFADDEYATAADLYQSWWSTGDSSAPYPDYVTGVWSADGTMDLLVIGVTKDERGEAGKDEILRLVADDSSVTFTYQNYSYAELAAIQQEITPYMGEKSGAYASGVYDMENIVHIEIDSSNPGAGDFMKEMARRYGDKVVFETVEGGFVNTDVLLMEDGSVTTMVEDARTGGAAMFFPYVGMTALLAAAAVFFLRRPRAAAAISGGASVTVDTPHTTEEIEEAYRADAAAPSTEVDRRILDAVRGEK